MKKAIYKVFDRKQRVKFVLVLVCAIVVSSLDTINTISMLPFTSAILDSDDQKGLGDFLFFFLKTLDRRYYVAGMCVVIALLYVLRCIFAIVNVYIQQRFCENCRVDLARKLFLHISNKPYSFFAQKNTSEIFRTIDGNTSDFIIYISSMLSLFTEVFTAAMILLALTITDWKITIIVVVTVSAAIVGSSKIVSKNVKNIGVRRVKHEIEKNKWIYQFCGGIKGIIVNRKQDSFVGNYIDSLSLMAREQRKYGVVVCVPRNLIETVTMVSTFLALFVWVVNGRELDQMLPVFATFAIGAMRLLPSANRVVSYYNNMKYVEYSIECICSDIAESSTSQRMDSENVVFKNSLDEKISIERMSYRFDDSKNMIFDNVSLEIKVGESIAFIGKTGAGKTTLADIILGLRKPKDGTVTADGVDIYTHLEWWSKRVGYIPQNIYLCDASIAENIAYGHKREDIDDNKVWKCLEQAQLKDFVVSLPNGIETRTGENGTKLSGGQKQRIGIARALYFEPDFLVMDEATSALDSETENAVMDAIEILAKEKTLLIIAHRLSTIEKCNHVYRIDNGRIDLVR